MRRVVLIAFPIALVVIAVGIAVLLGPLRGQPAGASAQPLQFDHAVHVRQAGIECAFCHRTADEASTAGYPDVQQCMFCHQVISQSQLQPANKPDLEKLRQAWVQQQAIDWVRIHRVPDHVHFPHDAHIQAGFTCAECHGDVGSMGQVVQVRPLNMGDCVACHRQNSAPTECATCHY